MVNPKEKSKKDTFHFKQFSVDQDCCSMKVGTDGVLLGTWADVQDADFILDIGTGTGLIALLLAQRSKAMVHAVEIEEAACKQAVGNFDNSPWKDRMQAFQTSIQDFSKTSDTSFDLIVSNPPFFSGGVFSANQERANVRHTIKLPNGDLLNAARNLLSKDGRFCVILPVIEGLRFKEMAESYGLYCNKITALRPKPELAANRMLMQFEKEEKELLEDDFIIRNSDGQYSESFINLTQEFYLNSLTNNS